MKTNSRLRRRLLGHKRSADSRNTNIQQVVNRKFSSSTCGLLREHHCCRLQLQTAAHLETNRTGNGTTEQTFIQALIQDQHSPGQRAGDWLTAEPTRPTRRQPSLTAFGSPDQVKLKEHMCEKGGISLYCRLDVYLAGVDGHWDDGRRVEDASPFGRRLHSVRRLKKRHTETFRPSVMLIHQTNFSFYK